MSRPIDWKQHHSLAELEKAYKQAGTKQHQNRLWAILQLRQGKTAAEVADALLVQPRTIYAWLRRYQHGGLEGLLPGTRQGRNEKLPQLTPDELQTLIREGGFKRLAELAAALKARYGVSYTPSGIWHLASAQTPWHSLAPSLKIWRVLADYSYSIKLRFKYKKTCIIAIKPL